MKRYKIIIDDLTKEELDRIYPKLANDNELLDGTNAYVTCHRSHDNKKKIDIFDYITDLEKEIEDFDDALCKFLPRLDFFLKIPNIEVDAK